MKPDTLQPRTMLSDSCLDLNRALRALPMEQRVVVSLTYYHEMGYKEIAETMECPVNTVKTRMFHARQRLRFMLSDSMEEIL